MQCHERGDHPATDAGAQFKGVDMAAYYSMLAKGLAGKPSRVHSIPQRLHEFQEIQRQVIAFSDGRSILELACGIGFWTERMCEVAKFIYATDISETAIELARKRVSSSKAVFEVQNALSLRMPNNEVDAVFGGFWLSHIRRCELQRFFACLNTLLPNGARTLFVENEYPTRASRPFSCIDIAGDTYESRRLEDGSEHAVLKNYFTDSELLEAVSDSAVEIEIIRFEYYWTLTYKTRKP